MKIKELYALYKQHYLVDTDTRNIRKNTLFFALKGANFNGNSFALEALKKGALFSIVDEKKYQTSKNIILVNNVLQTLQKLAHYHRQQLKIPIIGLTGSNGKTTTKELINTVLSKHYKTTATKGNLNNHIGVPLTLLSITPSTEIGIIEMGANHLKEIEFLANIAAPDYGYITNFGKAHLEGFGGINGVIKGKTELYNFLRNHQKSVFINPTDSVQVEKASGITQIPFHKDLQFIAASPFVRLRFKNTLITSNLIGKYNYNNIAAAISIGSFFSISLNKIKSAIENYIPTNNRSQIIKKNSNQIILDAYNANPSSMEAALQNFNGLADLYKTVILGDMFELGKTSLEEHQNIADLAASFHFNQVFLVGETFNKTTTKLTSFKTYIELEEYLTINPIKESTILIKGSRGMALERILEII